LRSLFSTQSVRNLQPVVEERVDRLLEALHKIATTHSGTPLDIMYPFAAFSNGVLLFVIMTDGFFAARLI
jgi:hypothetical protein